MLPLPRANSARVPTLDRTGRRPRVLAGADPTTMTAGGGSVTIYSGRTQNLIEPILDRFAEETGISVEVRYGDTADLALLIGEEGDQSPADVFLSQSPGAVGYLDRQGLLGTLPDDVLDLVAEGFHAGDGNWVGSRDASGFWSTTPTSPTKPSSPTRCSTSSSRSGRAASASRRRTLRSRTS